MTPTGAASPTSTEATAPTSTEATAPTSTEATAPTSTEATAPTSTKSYATTIKTLAASGDTLTISTMETYQSTEMKPVSFYKTQIPFTTDPVISEINFVRSSTESTSRESKSLTGEPNFNITDRQSISTDLNISSTQKFPFEESHSESYDTFATDDLYHTGSQETSSESNSGSSDKITIDYTSLNFQTDDFETSRDTTKSPTVATDKTDLDCSSCDDCIMPDVSDCTKYIRCKNGSKISIQCPLGYLFNNLSKKCDTSDKVSCNTDSTQCFDKEGFFPDPENCSSFVHCYHGIAYEKTCSTGLLYNPTKRTCDSKDECGTQPIWLTSRSYDVECDCEYCALPDSDDCSKYYLCLNSTAYQMKCGDGLRFNPEISNCDYTDKVACAEYSPECLQKNGFFPNSGNCSKYYHCVGGVAHPRNCDKNKHFSISTENCEDPCDAECDTSLDCSTSITLPAPVCKEPDGFYPHPTDCNKFYKCVSYLPVLSECIGDEHFSPINEICTDPCDALCDLSLDCVALSIAATLTNANLSRTTPSDENSTSNDLTTHSDVSNETGSNYETSPSIYTATEEKHSNTSILPLIFETESPLTDETIATISLPIESLSTAGELITAGFRTRKPDDISSIQPDEIVSTINPIICEKGDGVYPKSGDCTALIACMLGKPREMNCPEGLHFSPTTKHCEYPCVAKCDVNLDCFSPEEPTSSTPSQLTICPVKDLLPVEGYCAHYYNCTDGIRKKMKCPPRLHFNPSSRACDFPSRANCDKPAKPLPRPDELMECPCETCILPSTENCNDYYLCLNKTAYHMTCSNGLLFDLNKNTCNFADVSTCDIAAIISSTITTTNAATISESITTKQPTTASKTTTVKEFKCPHRNGMFRNPNSCGSFIHCSNYWPYVKACPGPLHFNVRTERCEYPCFAQCDASLSCVHTQKPETTRMPGFTPDPLCLCINCRQPSEESCTKYIECKHGRPTFKTCPRGKTFDSKREECDWAHRVDCRHSDICFRRSGLFPYKGDCHKFVHCSNGIPYIKTCPVGLEFDEQKLRCEWPSGKCDSKTNIVKSHEGVSFAPQPSVWKCPSSYGYFHHDKECKYFYICINGVKHLRSCSQNLLFNPKHDTCDWPKSVKCHDTHKHSQKRCRVFDRHVECSQNRTNLANPHCDMFYDCSTGSPCARRCPKGLYFNAVSGTCDEPQNVTCSTSDGDSYSLKEFATTCKRRKRGHMRDPANSSCYYRCDHDKVERSCCSRSRVFDERRNRCIWHYKYF